MYHLMGADLRLPERADKDAPYIPRGPLVFNFKESVMRVYYWWKTGDWPTGTTLAEQATKVKMVVNLIVLAEKALEMRQALRHEGIARALGVF